MARSAPARRRLAVDKAPRSDVVRSGSPILTGGFTALWESATQEILAVTYWFDPAPHAGPYPVTVRFSGRRIDAKGRLPPGDRFVHDETIEEVIPGSGPISLTARISGINAGSWAVRAHMLGSAHPARWPMAQDNAAPAAGRNRPAAWLWSRWAPPAGSALAVRTCPAPFARVPGILPGIWGALVTLGMAVALILQALMISADHLTLGPWLAVSLVAIAAGIAGAKAWFIVLHRREHRIEGWCIQGFIAGATLAAAILLVLLDMPIGVFLDVTAPGLLVAMALGRVGCFFAGCCGGPPSEIARQLQEGLLSRPEADVFDILATSGVVCSVNNSSGGNEQAERSNEETQRVLISHIHLRCLWNRVPTLRGWIAQFLAKRQPDANIIASGMAKHGVTQIAVNKQQAIEGFLVIASMVRELHGSIAEQFAAHLAAEGQITGYTIYTISIDVTLG